MAFPRKTIYLAGPITGLTHDEARYGWRQEFARMIERSGVSHISCSSPMRGKEHLQHLGILSSGHDYPKNAMSTAAGITTRDFNDVKTSAAMIACYLESGGKPSLGTAVEFGYCWALQIPIIVVGPQSEINVRHIMLQRMAGYHVETLEEAAVLTGHLLTPGL